MPAVRNTRPRAYTPKSITPQKRRLEPDVKGPSEEKPRILVIGAGYRGYSYAEPIYTSGEGVIAAVAEPSDYKRQAFGERFIWGKEAPVEGQSFKTWESFVEYEVSRRELERTTGIVSSPGIDGVFICLIDDLHATVVQALAPLGLHIMCEKPLATRLNDILSIYGTLLTSWETLQCRALFSVGLVLRYSLPQVMLRKIVREDRAIGDIISVEHTEAVGWKHFEHCYVRGPYRRESISAPSLLTKSSHDIDFLLWLLCSPATTSTIEEPTHLPSRVTSSGRLHYFKKANKPIESGKATNCLSCPIETTCQYSAKSLYLHQHLRQGNSDRPVSTIVPDIEDVLSNQGLLPAANKLLKTLGEDYDSSTPVSQVRKRPWYGRCVWESDNDVCDDQMVTLEWEDDRIPAVAPTSLFNEQRLPSPEEPLTKEIGIGLRHRPGKLAQFHLVALTDVISRRRGRISGTLGEISYDAATIRVNDFRNGTEQVYDVPSSKRGHDGGDDGLALSFVRAIAKVKRGKMPVEEAQGKYLKSTVEELLRSHLAVFWIEEARLGEKSLKWEEWWSREVESKLKAIGLTSKEFL